MYKYMDDLILLDACRPAVPTRLPTCMEKVHGPLPWREWDRCLATHLDQCFHRYISDGLHYGFRVGFDYHHDCRKSLRNRERCMSGSTEYTLIQQRPLMLSMGQHPKLPSAWKSCHNYSYPTFLCSRGIPYGQVRRS